MTSTTLNFKVLSINGNTIAYETAIKIKPGSLKRTPNPQINGGIVYTTGVEDHYSVIPVSIRVTDESNDLFDTFFENGNNNTITFGSENFTSCTLLEIPEREDQGIAEYMFNGDPVL